MWVITVRRTLLRILFRCTLFVTLFVFVGCIDGPRHWTRDEFRFIPLEHSRAVEPLGEELAARKLDYNMLYVAVPAELGEGVRSRWLRFWPMGRVLEKTDYSFEAPGQHPTAPTAANTDIFRYG